MTDTLGCTQVHLYLELLVDEVPDDRVFYDGLGGVGDLEVVCGCVCGEGLRQDGSRKQDSYRCYPEGYPCSRERCCHVHVSSRLDWNSKNKSLPFVRGERRENGERTWEEPERRAGLLI